MTTTQAYENDQRDILPIILGGTGTTTPKLAVTALGGISQQDLGVVNGIASLDSNVKVMLSQLPQVNGDEQPAIDGPISTYALASTNYVITNYDLFAAYSLSVNKGSVTRNGKNITYTPSAQTGVAIITVNNTHTGVNVLPSYVDKPVFLTPLNNAVNLRPNALLTTAVFSCTGFQDTHLSTSWQIATDSEFANIVEESLTNTTSLLNYTTHDLLLATSYYARVKLTGTTLGDSVWSDPVQFTITNHLMPENEVAQLHSFPGPINEVVTGYMTYSYGEYVVATSDDGNVVVTSDPRQYFQGLQSNIGRVFIYNYINDQWVQNSIETLVDDSNFYFGKQVGISIDKQKILVVSEKVSTDIPDNAGYAGEVRIYQTATPNDYSVMNLIARYSATENSYDYSFGQDVAYTPNFETIIISGLHTFIYRFTFNGTTIVLSETVPKPVYQGNQYFGETVSLSDDGLIMVTGAEYAQLTNTNSYGTIHIYNKIDNVFTLVQTLEPDDHIEDSSLFERYFGWPVVISPDGTKIATFSTSYMSNIGNVYLFEKVNNTWVKTQKFVLEEMGDDQLGGEATALSFSGDGTLLLMGSAWQSTPASFLINGSWDSTGMAYLFDLSGLEMIMVHAFIASDGSNGVDNDYYGSQVALSRDGGTAVITSPYRDWAADSEKSGTVYVYK